MCVCHRPLSEWLSWWKLKNGHIHRNFKHKLHESSSEEMVEDYHVIFLYCCKVVSHHHHLFLLHLFFLK